MTAGNCAHVPGAWSLCLLADDDDALGLVEDIEACGLVARCSWCMEQTTGVVFHAASGASAEEIRAAMLEASR